MLHFNNDGFRRELTEHFENREQKLKEHIEQLKNTLQEYQSDTNKEFSLKDMINERQNEYIGVLKKELVLAKNIIKHPTKFEKAHLSLNYDLYPIRTVASTIGVAESGEKYTHRHFVTEDTPNQYMTKRKLAQSVHGTHREIMTYRSHSLMQKRHLEKDRKNSMNSISTSGFNQSLNEPRTTSRLARQFP